MKVKTLKKLLKKAGLKVSGKKATLTRRAKKARLFGGLGRAPQSKVSSFLSTKAMFENSPEEKASRTAAEAEKARQVEALQTAEALNPQAKKERLRDEAQAEHAAKQNVQHTLNSQTGKVEVLPGGGKNKRSRRR